MGRAVPWGLEDPTALAVIVPEPPVERALDVAADVKDPEVASERVWDTMPGKDASAETLSVGEAEPSRASFKMYTGPPSKDQYTSEKMSMSVSAVGSDKDSKGYPEASLAVSGLKKSIVSTGPNWCTKPDCCVFLE